MPATQQMPSPATVTAEELGWAGEGYRKQPLATAATSYGEQEIKDLNNQKTGFGPR